MRSSTISDRQKSSGYWRERSCEVCGASFWARVSDVGRFCGHACYWRIKRPTRPATDRFWEKVNKDGPVIRPELGACWLWTGYLAPNRYGSFWDGAKKIGAHRYAYMIQNGELDDSEDTLHRCDNPSCVRGDHLFKGNAAINAADMVAKGRVGTTTHPESIRRGEANKGAKLTTRQVLEIRARIAQGETNDALANMFGVGSAAISHIATGRNWKHLLPPEEARPLRRIGRPPTTTG
jgi:hypothetical protein